MAAATAAPRLKPAPDARLSPAPRPVVALKQVAISCLRAVVAVGGLLGLAAAAAGVAASTAFGIPIVLGVGVFVGALLTSLIAPKFVATKLLPFIDAAWDACKAPFVAAAALALPIAGIPALAVVGLPASIFLALYGIWTLACWCVPSASALNLRLRKTAARWTSKLLTACLEPITSWLLNTGLGFLSPYLPEFIVKPLAELAKIKSKVLVNNVIDKVRRFFLSDDEIDEENNSTLAPEEEKLATGAAHALRALLGGVLAILICFLLLLRHVLGKTMWMQSVPVFCGSSALVLTHIACAAYELHAKSAPSLLVKGGIAILLIGSVSASLFVSRSIFVPVFVLIGAAATWFLCEQLATLVARSKRTTVIRVPRTDKAEVPWFMRVVTDILTGSFVSMFAGATAKNESKFTITTDTLESARLAKVTYELNEADAAAKRAELENDYNIVMYQQFNIATIDKISDLHPYFLVAEGKGERAGKLYLCIRGSVSLWDWAINLQAEPTELQPTDLSGLAQKVGELIAKNKWLRLALSATCIPEWLGLEGKYHCGMLAAARTVLAMLEDVKNPALQSLRAAREIHVVGHSLGGGVSMLLATLLTLKGYKVNSVTGFGLPRVFHGNSGSLACRALEANALNFVHKDDPVPRVLGSALLQSVVSKKAAADPANGALSRLAGMVGTLQDYHAIGRWVMLTDATATECGEDRLEIGLTNFNAFNDHLMTGYRESLTKHFGAQPQPAAEKPS